MQELLRFGTFAVFLFLGLRIRRRQGAERRRAVQALLAYVLGLSAVVGVLQWDDWPFTSHTIAVGRARADSRVCQTQLFGKDARGREWRLDPYTFTPVYDSILQYWMEEGLPRLPAEEREAALAFLLARAEESRRRLSAGGHLGPQRLLGRAGAPYWLLLPRWTEAPPDPYVGLRAYQSCWTTEEALRTPFAPARRLTASWPPGPGA
jgi:hypothetical protein